MNCDLCNIQILQKISQIKVALIRAICSSKYNNIFL